MKCNGREIQLCEDANLWLKVAIISRSRDINLEEIVGNHELTTVPRSLMKRDGSVYSGGRGKSELVTVLKKVLGEQCTTELLQIDCTAIDAGCMLNHITKPTNAKTGADLATAVCEWIDNNFKRCTSVIIAFDTYLEKFLKSSTREDRYSKYSEATASRHYEIYATTNISRLSMKAILVNDKTKKSLVEYLVVVSKKHLLSRCYFYCIWKP